jgi:MraZ protein
LGEYTHTIDDKGRLTIPAKFRAELAAGLVVTRGFEKCLMIFSLEAWQELAERVKARPMADDDMRDLRRRLYAGAVDLEPDRQGRIILPPYLREFAGINGDAVIAGLFDYIEVWSAEEWSKVRSSVETSSDKKRWNEIGI